MEWLLCFLAVIVCSFIGVGYKWSSQKISSVTEIPILIAVSTGIMTVVYAVMLCFTVIRTDITLILPALLTGFSTFMAMYSLYRSMKEGFYVLTIVFSGLSFCIPILLSVLFLQESVSIWQLCGIIIMVISTFIVNVQFKSKKKTEQDAQTENNKPKSKSWIFWGLCVLLFSGLLNFGSKLQQFYMPGEGESSFNFFSFLFCSVIALIFIVIYALRKKGPLRYNVKQIKGIMLPCLVVALGAINSYVQSVLPQYVNASVQFTVCNGGNLVVGVLIGIFFYREKFTWRTLVTLLCGSVAIVLQVL